MRLARRIEGVQESVTLALAARARALKAKGVEVVSFTAGEPDFDTPEVAKAAARAAIDRGDTKYTPAGGTPDLKAAVCEKLKRDQGLEYRPDEVLVSCGAKHSLYNLFQVLLDPGDEAIIPAPYWLSYPEMARLAEARSVLVETLEDEGWRLSPRALAEAIGPRTRVLVLNSPSNPTGALLDRADLEAIADVVRRHPDVTVISDEIYEKLVYGEARHESIATLPGLRERTIVVNGASKAFAMTGWRIGYAAGPAPAIDAAMRLQSHSTSNPASIAQAAAARALRAGDEIVAPMREAFDARRRLMCERLRRLPGCTLVEPRGAFYAFLGIGGLIGRRAGPSGLPVEGAASFCDAALEGANVLMVPGEAFGSPRHVRLSYATATAEIERGLDRLEQWFRTAFR